MKPVKACAVSCYGNVDFEINCMGFNPIVAIYKEIRNKSTGNLSWMKTYGLRETGYIFITKNHRNKIKHTHNLTYNNVNILNSRQRHKFKKMKLELDQFFKDYNNMTCDGYTHKNLYQLTNKCDEFYSKAY